MTLADRIATGTGPLEYRLVIEGCEIQPCTTIYMRGPTYGASILPAAGSIAWTGTGGSPTITSGQADPVGGTSAFSILDNDAAAYESARTDLVTYRSGAAVHGEVWIKRASGFFVGLQLMYDGTGNLNALSVDPNTGAISVRIDTFSRYECVEAVDGWWRVRFEHAGYAATTVALRVHAAMGTTYPTITTSATGTATIYAPKIRLADGRKRVDGLNASTLGFTESAYLAGAEDSVAINPVTIAETSEPDLDAATAVFSRLPRVLAFLDTALATGGTVATVKDATDLDVGDYVHAGTETLRVVSKAGVDVTVERAQWGTTAQRHDVTVLGTAESLLTPIEDSVGTWTKRRWWLYAHGASELGVTDEGTLAMQGVIAGEPELIDGVEWSIALDSRWALLEQEVAANAGTERKLRGAYYSRDFPLSLTIARGTGATRDSVGASSSIVGIRLWGWYETNQAVIDALLVAIAADATITSWGITFDAVEIDGRWELYVTTASSDPRYIRVTGASPVDGQWTGNLSSAENDDAPTSIGNALTGGLPEIVASTRYWCAWEAVTVPGYGSLPMIVPADDMRRIPRTTSVFFGGGSRGDPTDADTWNHKRIYLDNIIGLADGDEFPIPQPLNAAGEEQPAVMTEIFEVNTVDSYIRCSVTTDDESDPRLICAGASSPVFVAAAVRYGDSTGESLAGFRDALVADAPDGANSALTPWVLDDDLASWTDVVDDAASGRAFLTRRRYSFSKGQRLEDVLKHEARLLGVFFYLDADFKIAVRPLTIDTAAVSEARHIEGDQHITSDGRGDIRSGIDGQVNVLEIQTGYDAIDDKYTGNPIHVRSVAGISRAKARRVLEIRPKVMPADYLAETREGDVDNESAALLAQPVFAMFSGRIVHLTVRVPWTFFGVLVGDSVMVTDPVLPLDGARTVHDPGQGMIARRAIVVGRQWDFASASGSLTLLFVGLDAVGYTPTARVASAAGASNDWTLTMEANRYSPSGAVDASYFTANDRIRLVEWDDDAPTTHTGSVVSVLGNDVEVQLDTPWAGIGSSTWNLVFAPYDDGSLSDDQKAQAFCADSTYRLDDGATTRNAQQFAP